MNSPHKGQWRGALMPSLICAWINNWVNNRDAGDLRHHRTHYGVTVMLCIWDACHVLKLTGKSRRGALLITFCLQSLEEVWGFVRLLRSIWMTSSGPVFCLLHSPGCQRPITVQVTPVTLPVIGWAKSELTPSKRQKTVPTDVLVQWGDGCKQRHDQAPGFRLYLYLNMYLNLHLNINVHLYL